MNPEEMARYRVLSEQLRRVRRENDRLKAENAALLAEVQSLRQGRSAEDAAFYQESAGIFGAIHANHRSNASRREVFRP